MWDIVLIDGPNMSNLGRRDKRIYGTIGSLEELHALMKDFASDLGVNLQTFASNYEGEILEFIHKTAKTADGYLINPSGLTSIGESTRHALQDTRLPVVEVHFGNLAASGIPSIFSRTVIGVFSGMRQYGYLGALLALVLGLDDDSFLGRTEQPTEANRPEGVPWAFLGR